MIRKSHFAICMLVLLCAQTALAAHTRTWRVHKNTATTNEQVTAWHTQGTTRLQTDDDGGSADDRVVCLTISAGVIDRTWEYDGGDDVINNDPELLTCFSKLGTEKNSVALTSEYTGSPGANNGSKIAIYGNPDCSTLVHELGEIAGNGHVSVDKRFMTPSNDSALTSGVAGRKHASEGEKTKFEALN